MTEAEIRAAHPDWTNEQVATEVARLAAQPPTPPAPTPPPDDAAFARMRREKEAAEAEAQRAKDALAERERKEAEEAGKYKDLYEAEKTKNETLTKAQQDAENKRNAERTAQDLKFKDTGYALYLLAQDRIDLADAAAVKEALDQIAKNRADLVGTAAPPPSGAPTGSPQDPPAKLTRAQLAEMTPKQVAALDPKVVNEALAA